MKQPKCLVVAILMSLGIAGCGGSDRLVVSLPGGDAVGNFKAAGGEQSGEPPAVANPAPQEVIASAPSSANLPPVNANAGDNAGDIDAGELVVSVEVVQQEEAAAAIPVANGSDSVEDDPPENPLAVDSSEPDSVASEPEPAPEMMVQADDWWKPKASENLTWQWQLQDEIDTTLPVQVYNIDIEVPQDKIDELKARGIKLICYFSAGTVESFRSDSRLFPNDIIGEQYEDLVDERWVDYADIDALAPIMRARIEKCRSKGFDAIEIDNVDAHNYESRDEQGEVVNIGTNFNMTLDESIAYVRWLTVEAHSRGLGIGLKNAEEMVPDVVDEVDWMLVEDCYFDSWCLAATDFIAADKPVFMAEYDDLVPDFAPACELAKSLGYSAIWRDSSLSTRLYLACE